MKIYIAYKFKDQDLRELRKKLEEIDKILKERGHKTFIFFRDVHRWENKEGNGPEKVIKKALAELKKCDAILVEATESGIGPAIEAGYAKGLGKKIIVIHKRGSRVSLLKGLADTVLEYDDLEELGELKI